MQFSLGLTAVLCFCLPFLMAGGNSGRDSSEKTIGGPCEYAEIQGRAIILEVKKAPADGYNCHDAVEVVYTFEPDDSSRKRNYRFPEHADTQRRFTVGAGMNPPRQWAQHAGLVPGSSHRCMRKEIIHGACVPVVFVFPDIDTTGWEKACFP